MTNLYNSIILEILKGEDHRDTAIKALGNLEHTKKIKNNDPNLSIFDPASQQKNKTVNIKLVRDMISDASLGIYSGDIRVMILTHADTASIPAQNSLLKLIEEPPANTQIILTASNPSQLLPTIRSRCMEIPLLRGQAESRGMLEGEAMPTSYSQAIELAEKYKDREKAINFVEDLIQSLHSNNSEAPSKKTTKTLKILTQTLQHLHANVNVKLALEQGLFEIV